ncbi:hypothetical protein [Burkholderia ubonensis]|uniref:hypothetical protein n=1 Tax=Burkholderia ubonensis TaxID=101571 RepID=UPI000AD892CC|nr:hypothetical protein [Burkholderia ubonensis]
MKEEIQTLKRDALDRALRTPITQAGSVLEGLATAWEQVSGNDGGEVIERYFGPMWGDEDTNGDAFLDEFYEAASRKDPNFLNHAMLLIIMISCAYCVQAMKADKNGRRDEAWSYVDDARYWQAIVTATFAAQSEGQEGVSGLARKAAAARHAENYAMKADVFKWCDDNLSQYSSTDSAASAVAEKIVPAKFRTVQKWISEYKKDMRSARTV